MRKYLSSARKQLTEVPAKIAASPSIRRHKPDYQIILYIGLLMLLGLIVMYAIGPQRANVLNNAYQTDYYTGTYFFIKQSVSVGLALGAFVLMAAVPYSWLQKHAAKIFCAALAACALLVVFGNILHIHAIAQESLGAWRWFRLGPLGSLQPAEFLKFGILLFGAGFLGMRAQQGLINDRDKTLVPIAIIAAIAVIFVIGFQKDMGTGIALIAILSCMLMMSGVSKRLGVILLVAVVCVGVLFIAVAPHRIDRIATFFSGDTGNVGNASNYHIEHAKIAIGSGHWFGVGIGNSVQATGYLPEAINDSVFAIMGETFGFVGLVGILALFTALLLRLLKVADHLPDMRLKLLVAGVFGWLGAHVILNVAAMIGIFPLTGITLPLLSFGGTSMIFIAGALGLAFQLSRYTAFGSKLKDGYENTNLSSRRRFGGHVTPVVAVLRELKGRDNSIEMRFWCDRKFAPQAATMMASLESTVKTETIIAGKLRRYHHLTFLQHFTIPSVFWPNIRDILLVVAGVVQSIVKLVIWRPKVVFAKGGYVCLPVGWAAWLLRIPLVIHDSDAHPGLTNRLLARHATLIATGAPLEYYQYPAKKARYVGIPIDEAFRVMSALERQRAKQLLGMDIERPLVVVTGGGLGAKTINDAIVWHLSELLEQTNVLLISGNEQYDELRALTPQNDPRFQLRSFISEGMASVLGAADVVVARAGATTLLELAALAKPVVLVPNGRLSGGHQLKNAKVYTDKQAVVVVSDDDLRDPENTSLVKAIAHILGSRRWQVLLAKNIHLFAKPHAASDTAALILRAAGVKSRRTSDTIDHK